ncbi:uncharacterized protein ARMOST_20874 [Armillaria ostoyae]|uniref:Uncharacterized protein n=1 Tax=Armillaria ostoyae TaxID=47428 RepID=A0A284S8J9_ARMOS|nr:uncharacterized protein ARMOST_20874 [Armillaria ostoyae]
MEAVTEIARLLRILGRRRSLGAAMGASTPLRSRRSPVMGRAIYDVREWETTTRAHTLDDAFHVKHLHIEIVHRTQVTRLT